MAKVKVDQIVDQIVDPARWEIKLGTHAETNATALTDISWHSRAQEYRRHASARMYPLAKSDISKRVPKSKYHVSRKIDGQFALLIYKDGQVATVKPGGTVRVGLPWQIEAAKVLSSSGVSFALIAGEVYLAGADPKQRTRVHDVTSALRQPSGPEHLERIQFTAFDVVTADQESFSTIEAVSPLLETWFANGKKIHAVPFCWLESDQEVTAQFETWDEGAEGIVVRAIRRVLSRSSRSILWTRSWLVSLRVAMSGKGCFTISC
jgi:hypothetical protein